MQTGWVLLAHLSTPMQLSQYSLMAQIYGSCFAMLSTAGTAFWPVFVKRRTATEETVRMWWRLIAAFAAIAAIALLAMVALAPLAATMLSGGRIDVSAWLAFALVYYWWGNGQRGAAQPVVDERAELVKAPLK